ncbi:hypothetical protein CV014_18690 [Nostoc sp. CMAA1605]|nr:hypothetical protein [Nostoc sp. CMAA1605]
MGSQIVLILVPLITLISVLALQFTLPINKFGLKYISSAIFTALFVIGLHINIYLGINYCDPSKNTETSTLLNCLCQESNHSNCCGLPIC